VTVDIGLLEQLSRAAAPSGEERAVAQLLREVFAASCLEVRVDRTGNLSARIPGREQGLATSAVASPTGGSAARQWITARSVSCS